MSTTGKGTVIKMAISPFVQQAMATVGATQTTDDNPNLFSQNINYEGADAAFNATPQYNGNISATSWRVAGRDAQGYAYTYDNLDRMTEAKYFDILISQTNNPGGQPTTTSSFSTDNKFREALTYDVRGNILSLQRNGLLAGNWTNNSYVAANYGAIDNLTYTYNNKNQVTNIVDAITGVKGFKYYYSGPGDLYKYDANGNVIYDKIKGITNIQSDNSEDFFGTK